MRKPKGTWKQDPCKRLWYAVFVAATRDAIGKNGWSGDYHYDREQIRDDALMWFEQDTNRVGSFQWICRVLGIDMESVRVRVKRAMDIER